MLEWIGDIRHLKCHARSRVGEERRHVCAVRCMRRVTHGLGLDHHPSRGGVVASSMRDSIARSGMASATAPWIDVHAPPLFARRRQILFDQIKGPFKPRLRQCMLPRGII
jgi:hypothetical protein